jgi:UDP-glucose 4-epimerase
MVMPDDPGASALQRLGDVEVAVAGLDDGRAVLEATKGVDVVVHMAAQIARGTTPIEDYYDRNSLGTVRLLDAAVNSGVKRFVHASTDGTYDFLRPGGGILVEEDPQEPSDHYGTSKLLAEEAVRCFGRQYDLDYTILRFSSIIEPAEAPALFRRSSASETFELARLGRDSHMWKLFKDWPEPWRALEEIPAEDDPAVAILGPSGSWSLHLTDSRDVAAGVVLATWHPRASFGVFNMVGPETVTWTEGARATAEELGLASFTLRAPVDFAHAVSNRRATEVLGFRPEWTFRQTLQSAPRTVAPRAPE